MGSNLTQAEGLFLGLGAKMFSCCGARHLPASAALPSLPIAGPVIAYGALASVVYGIIYWIIKLL